MRIAVNTRLLIDNNMTGIGWFLFETTRRMVENHPEHQFFYFFDRSFHPRFITAKNITPVVLKPKCRFHPLFYRFWYDIQVSRALKKHNIDVFISPDGFCSTTTKVPTLLVIHDLAFVHYPKFIPWYMSRFLTKATGVCARKAERIATVSEYSKHDIHRTYSIPLDKIDVVYNGTHHHFNPLTEEEKSKIKETYTDGADYFLFVGTIHPRKNLKNQIVAFEKFRNLHPEATHKFLVVGTQWIVEKEFRELLETMQHKRDVIFFGHTPTEQLSQITAAAFVLMYASVFEGFGIPIIEAFQCGTPVITSNTSSMPEVAGDAALIVNPHDPDSILNAMEQLYLNSGLRQELIRKGQLRSQVFSWEKSAMLLEQSLIKMTESIQS